MRIVMRIVLVLLLALTAGRAQFVTEAAKTLRGIMSFRIKEAECVVEHDKIIAYRVTGKIVFLVER